MKKEEILVIDVETDALWKPSKIHVICTRTLEGETNEFVAPDRDEESRERFLEYVRNFPYVCGHNFIQYDLLRALDSLLPDHGFTYQRVVDTLVVSRLLNYSLKGGHSLEAWGDRLGFKKEGAGIKDWSKLTPEMLARCHSDTEINRRLILRFWKYLIDPEWKDSLEIEHYTAYACGTMSLNGFGFNIQAARKLRERLSDLVAPMDLEIEKAFPPRPVARREVHPRLTKHGTLNLQDFRWYPGNDLTIFNGGPFTIVDFQEFNPGSPKQIVERLNDAGWKPTDKTKGHIDALKTRGTPKEKLDEYKRTGWKVNEENLKTLPATAPAGAFLLAKRIVLTSRISDLTEWIDFASDEEDASVYGEFNSIGAWTHRLSHSKPNLANVPVAKRSPKDTEFETLVNDINDEMRALWIARKGRRLVGTDADGLQMRIFAHIVNDKELIDALINGSKDDGTDIHSLHQRKLGEPCKSRDAAKTFIYAWLLGAGLAKVAEILECSREEARVAVDNFVNSYPSLADLKETQIPADASRGYFVGLDGRKVICSNEHLMLAGYLQNGEAVIMKGACREWQERLELEEVPFWMVTWPHDEWQTEVLDDDDVCAFVQEVQVQAIRNQSERLGMNCPLDGSSSWGYTWQETH